MYMRRLMEKGTLTGVEGMRNAMVFEDLDIVRVNGEYVLRGSLEDEVYDEAFIGGIHVAGVYWDCVMKGIPENVEREDLLDTQEEKDVEVLMRMALSRSMEEYVKRCEELDLLGSEGVNVADRCEEVFG